MDDVANLEKAIEQHGYKVRYVQYCESSRTPGFLGQIRGVTDHEAREVRVSLAANKTQAELVEILSHELHHIEDPDWDCGGRDVLGRGGPNP